MTRRIDRRAVAYIAQEAVRRYGEIEPDLPRKLQRNIRRNVGITVPRDAIVACARHYKQVYGLASRLLPRYQRPPRGRYVDAADVRLVGLRGALRRRYPREPKRLIEMVLWYVVLYEYLK